MKLKRAKNLQNVTFNKNENDKQKLFKDSICNYI